MGKIKNGILIGKVGGAVYYERNGEQIVRSAPSLPSKRTRKRKETPAQWMTRLRFKYAFAFIRELKLDINELYPESKGKGSPFHKAVGRVIKLALIGKTPEELRFNFPLMPVAHGSLIFPPEFEKKLVKTEEKFELELKWNPIPGYETDTLSLVYFFENPVNQHKGTDPIKIEGSRIKHTHIPRTDGKYTLEIQELFHKEFLKSYQIYIYLYFRNEKKQLNSDSQFVYAGRLNDDLPLSG
jgi:hypothetical protein